MPKSITPGQIKKTNRQQIYTYIYEHGSVSQQDLTYALRLSRPTVASNLAEMEEAGLIYKSGQLDADQVGRKAAAYSVAADYRIAVGVEVMMDAAKIIAVDLYGKKIRRVVVKLPFQNEDSYYKKLCDAILKFTASLPVPGGRVLGVGFAMQGLIAADGTQVVYGAIMSCTGLTTQALSRYLPYPCSFVHDPDAAALSELWSSPDLTDAIYLSLSRHLGGSIIVKRNIVPGKHGHTATFEHIQARPRGELCYCGKRGCMETICSMQALLGDDDPEDFFQLVRGGAPEQGKRWRVYLKNLAGLIGMLHLVHDVDFILGGHLAPYFTQSDLRLIYDEIRRGCPFDDRDDYLLISKMPSHNINIGVALPYIQAFLADIGQQAGSPSSGFGAEE